MLDELDVFFGDASEHSARLYARLPRPADGAQWSVEGEVRGPVNARARTLPATYALTDGGPGETLLGEAIVTDPCFWTPDAPSLYEIRIRILHDGREVATDLKMLGIRRLGVRDRHFYFGGQRWDLLGVSREAVDVGGLPIWRESESVLVIPDPDEAVCAAAAREGVMIVARLNTGGETWRDDLRRLAHWASVGFVALDGAGAEPDVRIRNLAPNVILTQSFRAGQEVRPAPWARAVLVECADPSKLAAAITGCELPVVAYRRLQDPRDPAADRASCVRLQDEVAGVCECAGFIV